jgi:hypothetical protein
VHIWTQLNWVQLSPVKWKKIQKIKILAYLDSVELCPIESSKMEKNSKIKILAYLNSTELGPIRSSKINKNFHKLKFLHIWTQPNWVQLGPVKWKIFQNLKFLHIWTQFNWVQLGLVKRRNFSKNKILAYFDSTELGPIGSSKINKIFKNYNSCIFGLS